MFKIELYDNSIIKSAFKGISYIVDDLRIKIDHDGLYCDAIDTSHVAFCHLELKEWLFDEFEITEPTSINIDANEFNTIINRCKSQDILKLESDDNNLIITFEGDATRQFKIRLIDTEYETPTPPKVEYGFSCKIPTEILKNSISDIDVFSTKLCIQHEDESDYICISGEGDFGSTNTKYLIDLEQSGIASSSYSIEKLQEFMKSEKFSDTIRLKSGENIPLTLEFAYPTNEASLSYLLAPLIENDE